MERKYLVPAMMILAATPTAAYARGHYADRTWHGGEVGVDICYNPRGVGFGLPQWRFDSAPALPCYALR